MRSLALNLTFLIAGAALTLWIFSSPPDQLIFSASLCALAPFFALLLTRLSGGRIVISGQKSGKKPDAITLLMLPSLGLLLRALSPMHIVNWQLVLVYAVGIAVVWSCLAYFIGIFAMFSEARSRGAATFIVLLFIGLPYGYGIVSLTDTMADKAPSKTTEVTVLRKYIGAGKGHTPYLVLSPSSANPQGGDEEVSRGVYEKVGVSQKVCRVEHPGTLGLKWYEILSCERPYGV